MFEFMQILDVFGRRVEQATEKARAARVKQGAATANCTMQKANWKMWCGAKAEVGRGKGE